MKKTILAIAVLVGISTASFSFAGEKVNTNAAAIELVSADNLTFRLKLDSVKEKSSVTIKDENGTVLYSSAIPKSENYSKVFDLSNLLDGNYTFIVNNGTEITEKPFVIATETKRLVTAVK
ncbi:DUF3244 domain-containing protein [Dyadobacter diqingensis]|uniref:DUF3244 domain-containing protein n=1 Tax=Dyadobacter diqingensis TaxID=2938121 RepID=UPI0020C3212A|nr:DUF3244 domain-containing protein [Dyadobacter diqingensis]